MTKKSARERDISGRGGDGSYATRQLGSVNAAGDANRFCRGAAPAVLDETLDTLFDGRLSLYQSRRGYRCALDTVLLAFFVSVREGDKIMDLGTGNGALALILADLDPSLSLVGLEVQSGMVARAARNIRINSYEKRVGVVYGDVRAIEEIAPPESFDAVVSNPPYRSPHTGRVSPYPEKTIARHEIEGTLADFVRGAAYLLRAKGRFTVVYHAARMADLIQTMRKAGLEPKRLRMVHSTADSAASLVLVEGVKGGKSEMRVLPPLVVFNNNRSYTAELEAMLEGKRS